jgi:16S rRNA (guanine966-N2)-methyltransferase
VAASTKRGEVRIIAGQWRSRRLHFPERPGLRPTPDRVRETLFNWLGQDLTGKECLDLYAGSGALGFEAASRGARRVVMVERDTAAVQALRANRQVLGGTAVEVLRADALEFLKSHPDPFDVVFLDPPFSDTQWPQLLEAVAGVLAADGIVYCERARMLGPLAEWQVLRSGRAGQVSHQLLKRTEHDKQSGVPGNI